MTEEIPVTHSDDASSVPSIGSSLGARLRTAREEQGLDVDTVAKQLCLSPRQVSALEGDVFDALPSPTFVRGFIRNYAKLLQLDADSLLALYRGKAPESSTAAISLHSEGIPIQTGNRSAWLPYLLASVLVMLAGAGWWLYMDWRDNHPESSQESSKTEKPALPAQSSSGETQSEPAPMGAGMQAEQLTQPVPAPTESAPATASAPAVAAQSPQPTQPAAQAPTQPQPTVTSTAAQAHLVMKFSETSWVRVVDGDGKELINGNKPANSEETLDGKPPFKLAIGNINGVVVTYNGQPVDLATHAKGNVARLTLE